MYPSGSRGERAQRRGGVKYIMIMLQLNGATSQGPALDTLHSSGDMSPDHTLAVEAKGEASRPLPRQPPAR